MPAQPLSLAVIRTLLDGLTLTLHGGTAGTPLLDRVDEILLDISRHGLDGDQLNHLLTVRASALALSEALEGDRPDPDAARRRALEAAAAFAEALAPSGEGGGATH